MCILQREANTDVLAKRLRDTGRMSKLVVQGLGKTVTTIALLVSNHVEPEREWGRVQVDLNAPKRKRLKWENKPLFSGASTPDAKDSGEQSNATGVSGASGCAREQQEGLGTESDPAPPATDADTEKTVRFYMLHSCSCSCPFSS